MGAKKKGAGHNCVAKINAELAKTGDCLQRFISLSKSKSEKIAVATERLETPNWKRGSTWLLASFCPFCGVELRS